jgi:hypothetical protein
VFASASLPTCRRESQPILKTPAYASWWMCPGVIVLSAFYPKSPDQTTANMLVAPFPTSFDVAGCYNHVWYPLCRAC